MKNYLVIIRPFNCLFIGFAVLVGGGLNNRVEDYISLLIAALVAMLVAAGGYVINDFFDLKIDAVNKPHRILPRGAFKPEFAYMYAMFLFVFGFAISIFTGNFWAMLITLMNSFMLFYYAKKFKETVLIGNLIISYITASAFLFGAIITNNIYNIFPLLIFTFLYTLVREIIKDAEDEEGDKLISISTLATKVGQKAAAIFSLIPAVMLIYGLYYSYREGMITVRMFTIITLLYLIPLIIAYTYLYMKINTTRLRHISIFIKVHMLVLLIVYIITI